ncbi:hypothetical protein [Terricaulis sp.]|uniref:hypothetical protein n=1 Tax=Terricaulis sp. TaxID=2768686 RepID=UPI003783A8F7
MAAANPLNATFFAFRKRDRGGVITSAAIAYVVLLAVLTAAFVAINYAMFMPVMQWYGQALSAAAAGDTTAPEPPAGLMSGIGVLLLSSLVFLFALYLTVAAFEAACLRWMIRGESGGLMGLSLGRDTWNVYLTYWVWFFLYMGASIVIGMISTVATFAVLAGGQNGPDVGATLAVALGVRLLLNIVLIYFAVRLAPAAAVTVGRKTFAFFDAWKVTKGRFWAMFGAFLIWCLIVLVGEIVMVAVIVALIFPGLFTALQSLATDPTGAQVGEALAAGMNPQSLAAAGAVYLIFLALGLVVYVAFYGINARAVIAAAEDGKIEGIQTAAVAQTFD